MFLGKGERMATDFVRIDAQEEGKGGALQLGNYMKQNLIVLVDDDDQVLSITKLFLEGEGYRNLHVIQDSRLVIRFLKEEDVSLIVLDIMMPHIMGNELLSMLRNDFPVIPVIIMTAVGDMEIAEECEKLGAFEFLVKPIDPATLLSAIEKAMKKY